MSIFSYLDYKEAIRFLVRRRKNVQPGLTYSQIAAAMNIQKAYLSKVLNQDAHLNQDQLYLFCNQFKLGRDEIDFMSLLLERQRSGLESRRRELGQLIEKIQKDNQVTEEFIESKKLEANEECKRDYYLDAYNQLIHVCLSNKDFLNSPADHSVKLGLTQRRLEEILDELSRLGVIEYDQNGIRVLQKGLHLSKSEKVFASWRLQTRVMINQRLLQGDSDEDYNFTVFFSSGAKARKQIQGEFFKFLETAQKLSQDTEADEVYQMNFDFIRWL